MANKIEDLKYTINEKDFEGLTKDETVENLKVLWERNKSNLLLFDATEKERLRLLNENLNLKKKLGEFAIVKKLMDSAGEYGYNDLVKDPLDEIFVDKHDALVSGDEQNE